ncbi:ABC transporter substrate-binding protein [Bosea sp. 2KB_26]|uniref:ABC transporter substrate-binding protein n=1 Tax=Bosea sp. 2KB_26 TaxID=3237475 RepID=UPI003F91D7D9
MMHRRRFIATAAGLVGASAMPGRPRAADPRVLRFVPHANLTALDPIWTNASVTVLHGMTVFDTLYGADEFGAIMPQMAEGHTVSDDGRTWTIKLRDGLRWHDNTPVLARDCSASLRRWSKRDSFGGLLATVVEEWGTADDRTISIKLKRPFPSLLEALGKPSTAYTFMMPERIASTDPFRQITEIIGSGPFRFVASEYVSGSRVVYSRFNEYVPRQEAPSGTSGGKVVNFDRVEWHIIPDPSTAAAALQAGEVDWWDQVAPDLIPLLQGRAGVSVGVNDPNGYVGTLRFNTLHPPFDNPAIRRAVLIAANQDDYLRVITGNEPGLFSECHSMWPCGTSYGSDVGPKKPDIAAAKKMLIEAGYKGEKVVIINPSDLPSLGPFGDVTEDLLRKLGMNVEMVATDWGSVVQRRTSKEPVEKGGWSIFHTWWPVASVSNPAINVTLRGLGHSGWFGWYKNERVEQLVAQWLDASTELSKKQISAAIEEESYKEAPIVPLGRYFIRTAYRSNLTGFVRSSQNLPWGVKRN